MIAFPERPQSRGADLPRGAWPAALFETVFGARGVAKMSHLWLPCALILAVAPGEAAKAGLVGVLLLTVAVLCKVQFSILVNDLSDREDDRAAGKRRWVASLPPRVGGAVVAAVLAAGFLAVFLGGRPWALVAYAASALLGLAYSVRPCRCKERGAAGLAVYALSATLVYVVVPWAWLGARPAPVLIALVAVGLDKVVQILFHQVVDHAADLERGTSTYAVRVGLDRARATLRRAVALTCVALAGLVGFVLRESFASPARLFALLALAAVVLAASRWHAGRSRAAAGARSTALVRELPWSYLGLAYLAFHALPPVILALAAGEDRGLWTLALLSGLTLVVVSGQSLRYRHD
ncbi:MAG TPA: UbiA family prenyltransferase [Candidatus Methanoperedens sp.]|nr:UbiA family prenyltransferase [Candidatus Methanoperedens sp.]